MTADEGRCEPPPEWRDRDSEHHIYYHPTGTDVRGNLITVRWGARAQGWWADHLDLRGHNPTEAASMGWRYLAPVTPPAVVAALVEALERIHKEAARCLTIQGVAPGTSSTAYGYGMVWEETRCALALYRGEAGR